MFLLKECRQRFSYTINQLLVDFQDIASGYLDIKLNKTKQKPQRIYLCVDPKLVQEIELKMNSVHRRRYEECQGTVEHLEGNKFLNLHTGFLHITHTITNDSTSEHTLKQIYLIVCKFAYFSYVIVTFDFATLILHTVIKLQTLELSPRDFHFAPKLSS